MSLEHQEVRRTDSLSGKVVCVCVCVSVSVSGGLAFPDHSLALDRSSI